MASGSFSSSIVSGHYKLRVDWTSTPNTATNTSSVVVTAYLVNDWSLQVGERTVTNVVNGTTQTYTAPTITTTGTHTLGSVTQSVAHNGDGSKAITIQVTYPIKATIRDTYYSEIVASQSVTLDNIPRQSTISSLSTSNVTVGSSGGAITVNIATNSSSFTHKVTWTFGSKSSGERSVAASASPKDTYTIPASWLTVIPSAASGTGTVTVKTYNGSTQIGSAVSTDFTITAGVNPSIGSVSTTAAGAAATAGVTGYIAGYSTAKVTASTVAGVQGSTIAKYEFIQDGVVKATYNSSAASYNWTSGTLTAKTTFSVRVTDSRGRTATKAATAITPSAYAQPSITANAFRSNSSGTATADGTYIHITASATATPSANSITALTYATKATTASSYSSEANIGSGVTKSGFSNTTSYDVRIKATDKLGGVAYKYFTIPTASYTMDFKAGGKGVAFGKVAETDGLVESAWDIKSLGNISAKGYSAEYSAPASLSDVNNTIITKLNAMSNGTVAYLTLNPSVSISPFGGGRELIRVYRASAGYGTAEMSCYHSTAGERKFVASIYNGAVTAWRQDNGSRMLNFTASSAKALHIPNNYRGILYITDSTGGNCGEYFLIAGSSGATGYTAVKAASNVTLTNGTNTFTITPASGTRYCLLIDVNGYATE